MKLGRFLYVWTGFKSLSTTTKKTKSYLVGGRGHYNYINTLVA